MTSTPATGDTPNDVPTPGPVRKMPSPIYRKIRRKAPILVVLFCMGLLVFAAFASPFKKPPAAIDLRLPLIGADSNPAAGYVVIHNAGGSDTLLGASTPAAATVTIQQRRPSPTDPAGVLVAVGSLKVAGFEDLRLQPGSDQLLLEGLVKPLTVGEKIQLTLRFERAGNITVEADVQSYLEIADRMLPSRLKLPSKP
ncbi:COG2847 Copper(I)-binding protein [Acidimicrobiia bacterium]